MKKLIGGLLAVFLMAAGLVATTGSTANAAPRCPYTGCVATKTTVKAVSPARRTIVVRAGVGTAGNAKPSGRIKIIVKGNGKFRSKVIGAQSGAAVRFKIAPATYLVTAKFIPASNSVWARSDKSTSVTVKGKRRN